MHLSVSKCIYMHMSDMSDMSYMSCISDSRTTCGKARERSLGLAPSTTCLPRGHKASHTGPLAATCIIWDISYGISMCGISHMGYPTWDIPYGISHMAYPIWDIPYGVSHMGYPIWDIPLNIPYSVSHMGYPILLPIRCEYMFPIASCKWFLMALLITV